MEEKINNEEHNEPRMAVCNPVIWQLNSIRGVISELQAMANPHMKPLISLGAGDPTVNSLLLDDDRRSTIANAVTAAAFSALFDSYAPSYGLHSARSAVAEHLTRAGRHNQPQPFRFSYADVFLTAGATQAIHITLTVLSAGGSNILLPRPGFPLYDSACDLAGIRRRYYDLLPSRNWEADPDQLRALADDQTLAIVVINPNNPSGSVFSADHLLQIAVIARDLNIPIISDEVYDGVVFGNREFVPMFSFSHIAPVVSIGSLAKRWMVPGWRLGWLAICDPQGTLERMRNATKILMNMNSGPASVIQAAVPAILSDVNEKFHENVVALLESCADTLFKGLEKIEVMRCYTKPQGSMFMMVEVDTTRLLGIETDMDFAKELIKEESILVLPGSTLGLKNWVRLFFGLPVDLLKEACDRMRSFCQRRLINNTSLL